MMKTNNPYSNVIKFERQVDHLVSLGKRAFVQEAQLNCKGLAGDELKTSIEKIANKQLSLAKTTVTRQAGTSFQLEINSEPVQKALRSIDQTFANLQEELISTLGKPDITPGGSIRV